MSETRASVVRLFERNLIDSLSLKVVNSSNDSNCGFARRLIRWGKLRFKILKIQKLNLKQLEGNS